MVLKKDRKSELSSFPTLFTLFYSFLLLSTLPILRVFPILHLFFPSR